MNSEGALAQQMHDRQQQSSIGMITDSWVGVLKKQKTKNEKTKNKLTEN